MYLPKPVSDILHYAATEGRDGKGIVIIFAAGNGNESISDSDTFDGFAAHKDVISVGSVNAAGYRAEYSDFGEDLDIVAPSCDFSAENFYGDWTDRFTKDGIWTTDNSGEFGYKPGDYESDFCGTSASAPMIAGVAGILLSLNPDLTREELYAILIETADKVSPREEDYDENGFSIYYGYGRVNSFKASLRVCEIGECKGLADIDEETYGDIDAVEGKEEHLPSESSLIEYREGCSCSIVDL